MPKGEILVSEIFGPVIQGEGLQIGRPTVFVRTGGCDYRCSWCDTLYAVDPRHKADWLPMTPVEIFDRVKVLSNHKPITITLSGGNPALWVGLGELIDLGTAEDFHFSLETQGTVVPPWVDKISTIVLSPKPPSSGMQVDLNRLDHWIDIIPWICQFKIVVFNEKDLDFAQMIQDRYPDFPLVLSAGNSLPDENRIGIIRPTLINQYEWLVGRVIERGWFNVTVLPQLHVLVYGTGRGK